MEVLSRKALPLSAAFRNRMNSFGLTTTRIVVMLLAGVLSAAGATSFATDDEVESSASTGPAQALTLLNQGQLDALTAPIALYPDPLVAQILTASTYPLEVVEAARWLDDPAHAALKNESLNEALQRQSWDLSVKSLVPFPELLRRMNTNLEWTEQLGDAFLAQQTDVMQSVQRLRKQARAAGTLQSTTQEAVGNEGDDITIEPANPDIVYLPYYDPWAVYGPWAWPDYPPFYFPYPPGIYVTGPAIVFGFGWPIFAPLWGWCYWDWPRHGLFFPEHHPHIPPRPWVHDPDHRRGVPYRDPGTAARFLGPNAGSRPGFRGFSSGERPPLPTRAAPRIPIGGAPMPGQSMPRQVPPPRQAVGPAPRAEPRSAAPLRGPPVFESYGHGAQVHGEAARGSFSRSAPPAGPAHGGRPR